MIDAHRGAFEYDWRARFPGVEAGISAVGKSMTWGEAYRLTLQLARDPSSSVGAALAGWEHPVSREAIVFMDLYDLQHMSKAKHKPKPYPRPWRNQRKRTSPDADLTQAQVIEALRKAGHTAPLPESMRAEVISNG